MTEDSPRTFKYHMQYAGENSLCRDIVYQVETCQILFLKLVAKLQWSPNVTVD